jgi:hypothetical protein
MSPISVRCMLEVVGDFDESGGASLGLVAWELAVDEERVLEAWERAQADGLIKPADKDPLHDEQMWQLTVGGWAALRDGQRDSA